MSPVTKHTLGRVLLRRHNSQDVCFDDQFQVHDRSTSATYLSGHRSVFEAQCEEIISKKVVTIEVTKSIDVSEYIEYPHRLIKGTCTACQEEVVVVVESGSQWILA